MRTGAAKPTRARWRSRYVLVPMPNGSTSFGTPAFLDVTAAEARTDPDVWAKLP